MRVAGYQVVTGSITIPSDGSGGSVTISAPTGKVAIAGGWKNVSADNFMANSYPATDGSSWHFDMPGGNPNGVIDVYVVCVTAGS